MSDDLGPRFAAVLLVIFAVAVYVAAYYLYPAPTSERVGFRTCNTAPCATSGTTP